jgi:hypothetical protein
MLREEVGVVGLGSKVMLPELPDARMETRKPIDTPEIRHE